MSQVEEQEMEAEALTAIFDTQFQILQGDSPPFEWLIELWPETEANDNHVGVQLKVTLPETYPDSAVPLCDIIVLKGLTQDHAAKLLELAQEEAMNNEGVPSVFAICERLREWLVEHNQKGHDDISMHAQMLRREAEAERKEQQQQVLTQQYESQKAHDEMTETEREDLELRRKRAEGTPVTEETFETWKEQFEEEMRLLKEHQAVEEEKEVAGSGKKGSKKGKGNKMTENHKEGRLTGFQQFSDTTFNFEAAEAAAENAQRDEYEEESDNEYDNDGEEVVDGINEDLFDVDDEEVEDLDDLDFDDDDDDDDEEEVNI